MNTNLLQPLLRPDEQAPAELEAIRQRLVQLGGSLQTMQQLVLSGKPLPPYGKVRTTLAILLAQLNSFSENLRIKEEQLRGVTVFPGASFDVVGQQSLLEMLIRTKPLPESESWEEDAKKLASSLSKDVTPLRFTAEVESMEEDIQVGESILPVQWLKLEAKNFKWSGFLSAKDEEADVDIDRDDLEDIRERRLEEARSAMLGMNAAFKYMRLGT